MNMKEYKTKIFLTMIHGLLSVCLFTGCSNNVEPGKFVAINTLGKTAYSTDGINWTESDSLMKLTEKDPFPVGASWETICYGDGKYVAIAYKSNKVAYSTDGETWSLTTIQSKSTANEWENLTYGNGKFVAVSSEPGKIASYSTNGIDWYSADLPDDASWSNVCYGIGMFVAIAEDGETAYSENGRIWNPGREYLDITDSIPWYSVCYGKGKFVATAITVLSPPTQKIVEYSTNGKDWIPVAESEWEGYYDVEWADVCYGNGKFVMLESVIGGGKKAVYSTDGIHWKKANDLPVGADWSFVCYGNGMFVAIAGDGQMAYSEDGINWNEGAKLSVVGVWPHPGYWIGFAYGLDSDVFGFL